jgi:hypothetical protein
LKHIREERPEAGIPGRLSGVETLAKVETVAKDECGYYYEDDTAHPELPKQHAHFSVKALTGSLSMSLIRKTIGEILFSETSPLNLKR